MNTESINKLEKLIADYQQATRGEVDLKKHTCYAITCHSTAIEGSTLTEKQVYNLLDQDIPAKNKPFTEQQMVIDHQKALTHILDTAKKRQPVTESFIHTIGGMVMKNTGGTHNTALGTFDSTRGEYRLLNVFAGARRFPDSAKVPALMKSFIDDINKQLTESKTLREKCETAFYAHYRFVNIHPFVDGNGRTSRLLMNYVLAMFDLPIFYVHKHSRISYIQALERAREANKVSVFHDFMFRQYKKFLEKEIKAV
jgi:Fic family protein